MSTVGAAPRGPGAGPGATGSDLVLEHVTMVRRGLTLVDDLAELFDFFDVLQFHVHCLPCNFSVL